MSVTINGTSGLVFNDASTQNTAPKVGMVNRIINGAMMIDQRNAGASGTASGFTIDRWNYNATQASKGTWQQNAGSVTPPAGFTNYLGFTSSSAYSVLAGDYFVFRQAIEGFNTADLGFGTANASTVTLSFWVRSSLTGTFGGSLFNSATNRTYVFSYTINAANTWEQKSVTITGDTTGTWLTNNGIGISVDFTLAAGSSFTRSAGSWSTSGFAVTGTTSVVGTNGATFYITGVQLEKGSTATNFDYRPYGTELALCQRYCYNVIGERRSGNFYKVGVGGMNRSSTVSETTVELPVTMRNASPTLTWSGTWGLVYNGQSTAAISSFSNNVGVTTDQTLTISIVHATGPTQGSFTFPEASNISTNKLIVETEL